MACTIRLSEPLLKLRSRKELIETLLHEMIHAWNFVLGIFEENGGHGKNFLTKMHEINRKAGTNITVYHSFHDEVELYKKHWWRCNGACRDRKPYYGFVKRVSNRAPGPNDFWWKQHESSSGGKFVKVKEPEKAEKKKKSKKSATSGDIRQFFPTKSTSQSSSSEIEDNFSDQDDRARFVKTPKVDSGNTLGGKGSGRSRLLDNIPSTSSGETQLGGSGSGRSRLLDSKEPTKKKIKIDEPAPRRKTLHQEILDEFDEDDIILIDDEFDDSLGAPMVPPKSVEACQCPICNKVLQADEINAHLDECLGFEVSADTKNDSDVVFVDDNLSYSGVKLFNCPICNLGFEMDKINNHLDECLTLQVLK